MEFPADNQIITGNLIMETMAYIGHFAVYTVPQIYNWLVWLIAITCLFYCAKKFIWPPVYQLLIGLCPATDYEAATYREDVEAGISVNTGNPWQFQNNYAVSSEVNTNQDTGEYSTTTDMTTINTAQCCSEDGDGQPLVYAIAAPNHLVHWQIFRLDSSMRDVSPPNVQGQLPPTNGISPIQEMEADIRYADSWEYSRSDTASDIDYVTYHEMEEKFILQYPPRNLVAQ